MLCKYLSEYFEVTFINQCFPSNYESLKVKVSNLPLMVNWNPSQKNQKAIVSASLKRFRAEPLFIRQKSRVDIPFLEVIFTSSSSSL